LEDYSLVSTFHSANNHKYSIGGVRPSGQTIASNGRGRYRNYLESCARICHQDTLTIKVFINVCTDSQVPQPENVFGEELFSRIQNGEDWVVPVVISKQREDYDRAGKRCLVWDCCIHPRVVLEATKDKGVKIILIETCIELVEDSASVELSRGKFSRNH
jgi:hypothetical protein